MFHVKHPAHWVKGQLLDLKRYTDGTYRCTLLGEEWRPKDHRAMVDREGFTKADWEALNAVYFDSSHAAQQFTSAWYQPQQAQRYG